mgnify:CR=1 FL=1
MTEQETALKINDINHEIKSLKHRMTGCEENQKTLNSLVRSVDKLANSMDNMAAEQKEQGARLKNLENAPANEFKYYKRLIVGCIITGIIGMLLGAFFALIFK